MARLLKSLVTKELQLIRNNPFLPRLMMGYPLIVLLVFPWVANLEVKDIRFCVLDMDRSECSTEFIRKVDASRYFHCVAHIESFADALRELDKGNADLIVSIPQHFQRDIFRNKKGEITFHINSVNGTKGAFAASYISQIVRDYSAETMQEMSQFIKPRIITVTPQFRYNSHLSYKLYIIPALMVILLTIICGFLPALSLVQEKETGTIEQVNVSPLGKRLFVFSKLLPFWIIGLVMLTMCLLIVLLVYSFYPSGNILIMYAAALLFIITVSSLGIVVANFSHTMQQATFVMFFFAIVMLLMSGIFTPIESMPRWAQVSTYLNPLRYFCIIMRDLYLKNPTAYFLGHNLIAMFVFSLTSFILAFVTYRKR